MSEASTNIEAVDARHGTSDPHPSEPLRTYWLIFYWLMGLLVVTVIISRINLDALIPGLNIALALLIAGVKGTLVVLFFMHVKHASKLTWLFASAAFVWLAILVAMSFNDYLLRDRSMLLTPRTTAGEHQPALEHEGAGATTSVSKEDD